MIVRVVIVAVFVFVSIMGHRFSPSESLDRYEDRSYSD